jgi:uncharacterized damage-inducible protein DinB
MAITTVAVIMVVAILAHIIHHTMHHTTQVGAYIKVSITQAIYQGPIK